MDLLLQLCHLLLPYTQLVVVLVLVRHYLILHPLLDFSRLISDAYLRVLYLRCQILHLELNIEKS